MGYIKYNKQNCSIKSDIIQKIIRTFAKKILTLYN